MHFYIGGGGGGGGNDIILGLVNQSWFSLLEYTALLAKKLFIASRVYDDVIVQVNEI